MPIYEFRCEQCQNVFELLAVQSTDLVSPECPACKSPEISRILSRANVGGSSRGGQAMPQISSRTCGSGNCATIDLPGPSK
jgi:putative FmdB family regulatory protein